MHYLITILLQLARTITDLQHHYQDLIGLGDYMATILECNATVERRNVWQISVSYCTSS